MFGNVQDKQIGWGNRHRIITMFLSMSNAPSGIEGARYPSKASGLFDGIAFLMHRMEFLIAASGFLRSTRMEFVR
jgi:hypothetical protein